MYLFMHNKKIYYAFKIKNCILRFKQLPLNTKQTFASLNHLLVGERLLSGVTIFSIDRPLDFHNTIFPVLLDPKV